MGKVKSGARGSIGALHTRLGSRQMRVFAFCRGEEHPRFQHAISDSEGRRIEPFHPFRLTAPGGLG